MPLRFHHTAITTKNFDALIAFYVDLFGATLIDQRNWADSPNMDACIGLTESVGRLALMQVGGVGFEIFEFKQPLPNERDATTLAHDGITHIAFSCDDCLAEYERLRAAGMKFNAKPWKTPAGGIFTYGHDPDGNIIEILQPAPIPGWQR